jgi:hypothetical protein
MIEHDRVRKRVATPPARPGTPKFRVHARHLALGTGLLPGYTKGMLSLEADPSLSRQLPADGPMALWRDAPAGGREGLVLAFQACANPSCPCQNVFLEGWLVDENLDRVALEDDGEISFEVIPGGRSQPSVLLVRVDLETGELADNAPPGTPPSELWALEWLRSEMGGPLLTALKKRSEEGKRRASLPYDWRKDDWSWWKPGMDVSWMDVSPEEDAPSEIIFDNQTWAVSDFYCVEPGCDCEEVSVNFWRERGTGREVHDVGTVSVIPEKIENAQFLSHGADRALLKKLWTEWCTRFNLPVLLRNRREKMRQIGPEIHQLWAAQRKPLAKSGGATGPNDRCPCGSGKKFKRCCMGKAASPG